LDFANHPYLCKGLVLICWEDTTTESSELPKNTTADLDLNKGPPLPPREYGVDLSMVIVGFIVINQFVVWFLRVDYLHALDSTSSYISRSGSSLMTPLSNITLKTMADPQNPSG
jgi:hypothetical protein